MQTKELMTSEAPSKWWAAQDARMRNMANKSRYPASIRLQVERMMLVMDMVYSCRQVYDAFGKTGISIKIDGAWCKDKPTLKSLEEAWTLQGWVKKITPQGVIYRLTNR